jgi:sugar phosphate isomerase/epimerase
VTARIGLALYSVRHECARDLEATLREVAAMGFQGVEFSDLHGHEASSVRRWLDELGLIACARHARWEALDAQLPELVRESRELGHHRLVLSKLDPPTSVSEARRAAGQLTEMAARAAELGVEFGFHNHAGELQPIEDERTFVDELLDRTELFLELDLGWAWLAGADVLELLGRARGRCALVHIKDFERPTGGFCPVGDGGVDYIRIAPAAIHAGAEWLLVEQDESDGPALAAASRSLVALTAMLEQPAP